MIAVDGNALWNNINERSIQYPSLDKEIDCDIVVVGGGITGALCAYYLCEAGVKVVLVEKYIIGYGSTKASTSILQYEIDKDLHVLEQTLGKENAVRAFKLCNKAIYDIDEILNKLEDRCDFNFTECLYYSDVTNDFEYMKKEFEARKKAGFEVEFITEEEGKERFSFPLKLGIYSKSGAAQIDPYRFTQALISYCVKKGMLVFENTEISDIKTTEDNSVIASGNNFDIKASKVVIATGYEAKKYIEEKIVTLTRSFSVATKPVREFEGWYNTCIIRDNKDIYTYLRTTGDNRIIIGGQDLDVGGEGSNIMNPSDNTEELFQFKYNVLLSKLKSMFPNIEGIDAEFKFNGLFGDTKDGLPYIGEYEKMSNCYFCLGYGSNGILYATFGAQIIRDLYLGKNNSDRVLFRFGR